MLEEQRKLVEYFREKKKTLVIVCGFPYSGKTTVLHALAAYGTIVRIDDIFSAHGYSWTENRLPDTEGWSAIFREVYAAIRAGLNRGECVFYDSTNHTRKSRDDVRRIAEECNAQSCVLWIQVSPALVWKRWEENVRTRARSIVARDLVSAVLESFESPTQDEQVIPYANHHDSVL